MTTSNLNEIKSMVSLSSRSEGSMTNLGRRQWRNPELHERCTIDDMLRLRDAFRESDNGVMFPDQFQTMLREELNVEYDEEDFNILFLKINTNRDGCICWDEFVSHLLLGYFTNDPDNQRDTLEPPIVGLPRILRSMHRHPITSVKFCPDMNKDRSMDPMSGIYLTASRDGMINWWNLNMNRLRTAFSSSPILKVRTTWVTDMVVMPDVSIVVTSSTERDLRFYDCTAQTFTLKMIISSWEFMICTLHYHFEQDENQRCLLICGDVGGSVRVLSFSPIQRGPFQNQAARALIQLRHIDLQKHPTVMPTLQLIEFHHVHDEWVRQVSYYRKLHCVVSCATCKDSLLMRDLHGTKTYNMFRVDKGIMCFTFDEEAHVLATGGPDCTVRVWNPFVTAKPSAVLTGHHTGIVFLVLQDNGTRLYSMGRDRTIKVWDVISQDLIQTYIDIPSQVGGFTPITANYNPGTRDLVVAAIKIATITLNEQLNPLHTDGYTHSRAVSKILYNPLYKILISCGMGSIIINWNPFTGKRNVMIRGAHTRMLHGEIIPVEITAACFDPGYQLLLTGARNGTLKIWNFNNGVCMRNMHVEYNQEITGVFWIEGRIFCVGWNKHVTEFSDTGTADTGKPWETRHSDDVLAAAVRSPESLATATYNSELIFWKLETGQPYRRYSCTDPYLRIKMHYSKRDLAAARAGQQAQGLSSAGGADKEHQVHRKQSTVRRPSCMARQSVVDPSSAVTKANARRVSQVGMPTRIQNMRQLAVHAMLFLETRPFSSHVAALMVALENGRIQAWSDHPSGGLKGSFQGIHTAGDYVSAMATDVNNNYLFTGTTVGYIKVWLMTNYLSNEEVHINMPALRLEFPFLWRDRIEGRAKRSVRDQPKPVLLNSYRGHVRCITTMAYIDERKLLLTGSSDYSVRIWRLSGEYLQTLGSYLPWTLELTRFPPDVKKVASFTTFKVWRHGEVSRYVPGQQPPDLYKDVTEGELRKVYGQPVPDPILGHYFNLPPRPHRQDAIVLDDTFPTIPLYAHLRMASTVPVRRPPTPELVRTTRLKKSVAKKAHFEGAGGGGGHHHKRSSSSAQ